ncbi:MAG: TatD family deoxyribonuclease [Marmoricola sp.]|nr:TatD family deoxyribonuclease [Marmoricola sp.]
MSRSAQRSGERPPDPEPLPHPVVDNHCHLDIAAHEGPGEPVAVAEALARSAAVGVPRIIQIGVDVPSSRWSVESAAQFDAIVAGVALHPNEAPRLAEQGLLDSALAEIEDLAQHDRVRVVGETGLDTFRTGPDGFDAQVRSFRRHIEIAHEHDRTLMIHDREAHAEVLRVIDEVGPPERWVMHCFSGDAAFAEECLARGAHLSFAGTVTFKNAAPLREALRITPLDRILVETDAPFLTPEPWRGRPNASYLIPTTVRSMAATREMDLTELCQAIDANTEAAFGGSW